MKFEEMADGGFELPNSKHWSAVFSSRALLLSPLDSPTAVTRAELQRVSPASAVSIPPAAAAKERTEAEEREEP